MMQEIDLGWEGKEIILGLVTLKGPHNLKGLTCRMKYVRQKHRRGVGVRALRTVYMDVLVKEEKRDRQESKAVRNRCVEGHHWLNLLASVLIAQNPP